MRVPTWVRVTLTVMVCLAVGLGALGWWAINSLGADREQRCAGHERFLAGVWRDSTKVRSPLAARGCMVDDLLKSHDFRGRTRAQLVALLGEPPKTDYFREYDLVYWLGPERGLMSIDSEWLVFRLDSTGRVREHRLVTD